MKTIMEWEPDLGKTSIDVFEFLDWVIGYLSDLGLVKEPNRLRERLMDREAAGSTLVGVNLANPHAQLSEVSECLIFYIKLCDPILNWDGRHDVDRILVTLLPEKPDGRDLVRLRMLYRRMADEAFMNVLQSGTDTDVQQILLTEGK
ncbi:PTS sugar transporter subunit IIA [uncultured Bifidobacterium sp.]|uniref:PTS sugar transporter subunit IIA n=1 Tax=uncultured Bifidobacterium sp. TaxID=165187 RepID=UPI0025CC2A2E|nr:PTS sugar transporter subunit IIA [uncultured Bifidobacterium sp.]